MTKTILHRRIFLFITIAINSLIVGGIIWFFFIRQTDESFMKMAFVKGGEFTMGASTPEEDHGFDEEHPAHQVTLSSFYISKYLVTVGQFAVFVKETGYLTTAEKGGGLRDNKLWYGSYIMRNEIVTLCDTINWRHDYFGNLIDSTDFNLPVTHVSWNDANAYCDWLSQKEKKPYRLPTEAEWEFAARGGVHSKHTVYSGSNDADEVAWYEKNFDGYMPPVGMKKSNELGIYDMSGLVWEWCLDGFDLYSPLPQINPVIKNKEGDTTFNRVVRGGTITRYDTYCRVCNRLKFTEQNRGGGMGFRVAYSK